MGNGKRAGKEPARQAIEVTRAVDLGVMVGPRSFSLGLTMTIDNTRPSEESRLRRLYHQSGMSQMEIASALNTSRYQVRKALNKYGIEPRNNRKAYATYNVRRGYCVWETEEANCRIHQLLAIHNGEDPNEVFDDSNVIHHKNGVRWDNRVENIELLGRSEHGKKHWERGDVEPPDAVLFYTDDELLGWIEAFVSEFGVPPSSVEMHNWPGPSDNTYRDRFGSVPNAIREAGYEPRGDL